MPSFRITEKKLFVSRHRKEILLLPKTKRHFGPQISIQIVPRALSLLMKRLWGEADIYRHPVSNEWR